MSVRKQVLLNPTEVQSDKKSKEIFSALLHSKANKKILFEHHPYKLNYRSENQEESEYEIELTHNVMLTREKETDKSYQIFRFENQIGQGGFSMILRGEKKMHDDGNELSFSESHYVIKLQQCELTHKMRLRKIPFNNLVSENELAVNLVDVLKSSNKFLKFNNLNSIEVEKMVNEYETTKATGLKINAPLCLVSGDNEYLYSLLPIEYIKGRELFDVVLEDEEGSNVLSTKSRIALTRKLLKVYKEQFSDNGVVHRDLKLENVLVDMDPSTGEINNLKIIDLNLSKFANVFTHDVCGSPDYLAPEMFKKANADERADLYSLGKMISLIWRKLPQRAETLQEAYDNAMYIDFSGLYSDINDLDEDTKECIDHVIFGMTQKSPGLRPDLNYLLTQADEAFYCYTLNNAPLEIKNEITKAEINANTLLNNLNALMRSAKSGGNSPELISAMDKAVKESLINLSESPIVWNYFLERLDINLFAKAANKEAFLHTWDDFINNTHKAFKLYHDVKETLANFPENEKNNVTSKTLFEKCQKKYNKVSHDFTKFPLTVDNLQKLNLKINKAESHIEKLKELVITGKEKKDTRLQEATNQSPYLNSMRMVLFKPPVKKMQQDMSIMPRVFIPH